MNRYWLWRTAFSAQLIGLLFVTGCTIEQDMGSHCDRESSLGGSRSCKAGLTCATVLLDPDGAQRVCVPDSPGCRESYSCKASGQCIGLPLSEGELKSGVGSNGKLGELQIHLGMWKAYASPKSNCLAGRDLDCKESSGCVEFGKCTLKEFKCQAVSIKNCTQSLFCRSNSYCTPMGGKCVQ
jgi:hypothetical protein